MKFFPQPTKTASNRRIDGFKVLKGLLNTLGNELLKYSQIPLSLLENTALEVYNLEITAANRLYVSIQLFKFFKHRSMMEKDRVRITEKLWTEIYHYTSQDESLNDVSHNTV